MYVYNSDGNKKEPDINHDRTFGYNLDGNKEELDILNHDVTYVYNSDENKAHEQCCNRLDEEDHTTTESEDTSDTLELPCSLQRP